MFDYRLFFYCLSCVFAFTQGCNDSPDPNLPIVDLGYEIHQGTFNNSGQYYNFSNIRYAAPPVGQLRFQAPTSPTGRVFNNGSKAVTCHQAAPAWTASTADWIANGTKAFDDISAGYHPPNVTRLPTADPTASEDCLFLDVMVPKSIYDQAGHGGAGAPIMVWIHGGGYTLGSKTLYSPSAAGLLAASQSNCKPGVIWIGINYRLGAFGWLSGPTFQENGVANAGLHDQRFALDWVQEHAAKFGGNPKDVTIIGESAGGGSALHQITAYGGLKGNVPFTKAIVQSPGFQMQASATGQEAVFQTFLDRAGVDSLDAARNLSTEALQLVNYQVVAESYPYGSFTFGPTVDGSFVPALPGQLLLHGGYDKSVSVMAGHNTLEGLQFMDPFAQNETAFEAIMRVYFPTITDAAIQHITKTLYPPVFDGSYGYKTYTDRGELLITESFFTCSTKYLAHAYANQTWNYWFTVPPSLHGDDIPYTYFNGPGGANAQLVKNDTLAVMMQEYFTNFASTGTPNGPGLPAFPQYGGDGGVVLEFNTTSVGTVKDNVPDDRCKWWQKGLFA